jgi:hypothetical protein
MASVEQLRSRREKLVENITSLRNRVSWGDKTVERDLSQGEKALQLLDQEIARTERAANGKRRTRMLNIHSRKGI